MAQLLHLAVDLQHQTYYLGIQVESMPVGRVVVFCLMLCLTTFRISVHARPAPSALNQVSHLSSMHDPCHAEVCTALAWSCFHKQLPAPNAVHLTCLHIQVG